MLSRIAIPLPVVALAVTVVIAVLARPPSGPEALAPPVPLLDGTIIVDRPPPPPPEPPMTREEMLAAVEHQHDWWQSRAFADCKARGGGACCGQGGCCNIKNIPVSERWSLGLTWVDGDVATPAVERALVAPGKDLDACHMMTSLLTSVEIDLRIPPHGPIRLWSEDQSAEVMTCVAHVLDAGNFPRPATGIATVSAYYELQRE